MSKKEIVEQQANSLPAEFMGSVMADAAENKIAFDSEDLTLPYLQILQSNSHAVTEGDQNFVPNAVKGQFMNSVSKKLYDGKEGVIIVPCSYDKVFLEWTPGTNGNLVGRYTPTQKLNIKTYFDAEAKKEIVEEVSEVGTPGNIIQETRQFVCAILDVTTGEYEAAVLSMASSQIRVASGWQTRMNALRFTNPQNPAAPKFTPALFMTVWKLKANPQKNDQGAWYGLAFDYVGPLWEAITDKDVLEGTYNELKNFAETLKHVNVAGPTEGAPF